MRVTRNRLVRKIAEQLTANAFCATGEGGGVNPSCGKSDGDAARMSLEEVSHIASGKMVDDFRKSNRPPHSKENPATKDRPDVKKYLADLEEKEGLQASVRKQLLKVVGMETKEMYESDWENRSFEQAYRALQQQTTGRRSRKSGAMQSRVRGIKRS